MLRNKNQETNVSSSNKWQVSNKIPLVHILNLSARAPLWKMTRKKVNNVSTNKEDYQFRVGCVSYSNLKKTRHSKSKLISVCLLNFIPKIQNKQRKHKNKTILMSLLLPCFTITANH